MIHACRAADGSLYEGSYRPATHPNDVLIQRLWGPREVVMACGAECMADHARGRCVVAHVALIAAREAEQRNREAEALAGRKYALLVLRAATLRVGQPVTDIDARLANVEVNLKRITTPTPAA